MQAVTSNRPRPGLLDAMAALSRSRLFAYGSLLALQAKVVWGIWRWKDLGAGDTARYFALAGEWAENLRVNRVWSPLYLVYYGSLQWISTDPFVVTIAHRLIVVAVLDVLVLAVLRHFLPHGIAWLLAAWFALLPINFDSLYEVHLFAAVPTLLAVVVVSRVPGCRGRAAALGILFAATLLVRYEVAIAAVLWSVYCVASDRRRGELERLGAARAPRVRAYGAALALAALACGAVYSRSIPDSRLTFRGKLTGNLCQVYAFGYAQRHREWSKSPWTDCDELMQRQFGAARPTVGEALRANPRALLEHVAWNAALVPAGIQLQLFNRTAFRANPDYVAARTGSRGAAVLGVAALSLVVAGALLLWRERARRWRTWLRERAAAWALLGCLLATSTFVMLSQRPRPSYLFNQSVVLLAVIGTAAMVVAGRWRSGLDLGWIVPPVAAVLVLAAPPYYGPDTPQAFGQKGQPLRRAVARLLPLRGEIAGSEHRLLTAQFAFEICPYVGRTRPCTGVDFAELMPDKPAGLSSLSWIEEKGVDWIYADQLDATGAEWQALLRELDARESWLRVAPPRTAGESWVLWYYPTDLRRTSPRASAGAKS